MKKMLLVFGVILCSALSCSKDEDLLYDSPDSLESMVALAMFNGVEGSSRAIVRLDGELFNGAADVFKYGDVIRHKTVFPGKRSLTTQVSYDRETTNSIPKEVILDAEQAYSLFIHGEDASGLVLVKDNLLLPAQGKFKVRVANFDVRQNTVSLGQKGELGKYIQALKPNEVSDFMELDVSDINFVVSLTGRNSEPLNLLFSPQNQGVYTIWIKGSRLDWNSNPASAYKIVSHP